MHASTAKGLAVTCAAVLMACGGSARAPVPAARSASPASQFHVVAEGPCAKLSVETIAPRVFVVYGDTGYDLHDWGVGERLAAAQSVVEIRDGEAYRVRGLLDSLPSNAGGYVPADLRLGGAFGARPWLVTVDTRYAPRGKGALFEREARSYVLEGQRWQPQADASIPLDLPRPVELPPLPETEMCAEGTRFSKLAAATHVATAGGDVFFAGRCEGEGPVRAANAPIWIAHLDASAPALRWSVHRAPESSVLDGIVNVALWSRRPDDTYLVAYEPFKAPEDRRPYLARFDGKAWSPIETGIPEGLMGISGSDDGTLWIAAGRALYERKPGGAFTPVALPPLRFATEPHPTTLRIHRVRALAPDDVWVEGTYRIRTEGRKADEPASELRAGVLYRSRPGPLHFCDAREPAASAFTRVGP